LVSADTTRQLSPARRRESAISLRIRFHRLWRDAPTVSVNFPSIAPVSKLVAFGHL
jgi:hypothetical protein